MGDGCVPLGISRQWHFHELSKMSEEQFGLSSDSAVMNYLVSLVKRGLAKDLERAKASMVSTKNLNKMARMWKKIDAIGRKRITTPRSSTGRETANPDRSNKSSVVDKGHFVVSTRDKKRFCDSLGACKEQYFP
ncbi:hypothetical protein V6N11_080729 [Hibiscus sabdariffa]|uniref:Uncharacterized protein n=1 Tax=Hibiscus sabdariffa TaxID=183260 RepID=A0ABR2QHR0_9ROSI